MEITENTYIEDIINNCPDTISIFSKYNIQVIICGEVVWDTIKGIAEKNNIDKEKIIDELKKACND